MSIRIRIVSFHDRRTKELLGRGAAIEQARADLALEAKWRAAVAANVARREKRA